MKVLGWVCSLVFLITFVSWIKIYCAMEHHADLRVGIHYAVLSNSKRSLFVTSLKRSMHQSRAVVLYNTISLYIHNII